MARWPSFENKTSCYVQNKLQRAQRAISSPRQNSVAIVKPVDAHTMSEFLNEVIADRCYKSNVVRDGGSSLMNKCFE